MFILRFCATIIVGYIGSLKSFRPTSDAFPSTIHEKYLYKQWYGYFGWCCAW